MRRHLDRELRVLRDSVTLSSQASVRENLLGLQVARNLRQQRVGMPKIRLCIDGFKVRGESGATETVVLTAEDRTILTVLDGAGRALIYPRILHRAAQLFRDVGPAAARAAGFESLSETKLKERVPILERGGLVERPLGPKGMRTRRKGVAITDAGKARLHGS